MHQRASDAESLLLACLRCIHALDNSKDITSWWERILNCVGSNITMILEDGNGNTTLIPSLAYVLFRMLASHAQNPDFSLLRREEADILLLLLRKVPDEIAQALGRDYIRCLYDVKHENGFNDLWNELIAEPESPQRALHTNFQALGSLSASRRILALRVPPEMETQLVFLTTKVRFGQQKRYQMWFTSMWQLNPPFSLPQSVLVCDIIRWIVICLHPSNAILRSDVVPRWALLGFLSALHQSPKEVFAAARRALLIDWLCFQAGETSIMLVEPAILLIHSSLTKYPELAYHFMHSIATMDASFFEIPQLHSLRHASIVAALGQALFLGVISSLQPWLTAVQATSFGNSDDKRYWEQLLESAHSRAEQFKAEKLEKVQKHESSRKRQKVNAHPPLPTATTPTSVEPAPLALSPAPVARTIRHPVDTTPSMVDATQTNTSVTPPPLPTGPAAPIHAAAAEAVPTASSSATALSEETSNVLLQLEAALALCPWEENTNNNNNNNNHAAERREGGLARPQALQLLSLLLETPTAKDALALLLERHGIGARGLLLHLLQFSWQESEREDEASRAASLGLLLFPLLSLCTPTFLPHLRHAIAICPYTLFSPSLIAPLCESSKHCGALDAECLWSCVAADLGKSKNATAQAVGIALCQWFGEVGQGVESTLVGALTVLEAMTPTQALLLAVLQLPHSWQEMVALLFLQWHRLFPDIIREFALQHHKSTGGNPHWLAFSRLAAPNS